MHRMLVLRVALGTIAVAASFAACRGTDPKPPHRPVVVPETAPPPPTRIEDVTEDFHGTSIADPYRWLENQDDDDVSAWVDAQNARTLEFLDRVPDREAIRARLTELWTYPRWTAPEQHGPWWIWSLNEGFGEQAVLYRSEQPGTDGEVLLDPNAWSLDGTVALDATAFAPDGSHLAFATMARGRDWMEWRVLDVATGAMLEDHVRWSKFSGASWTHDGAGFFYQRYPAPKDGESGEAITKNPQLCYHELGTPQSADRVIYERPDQPQWNFDARVTEDGRQAIVAIGEGSSRHNRIAVVDLTETDWPVRPFLMEFDARYTFLGRADDTAVFVTDHGSPNSRVVAIPMASPAPPIMEWSEVVPEAEQAIEAATIVGDELVVTYLRDARHVLRRFSLEGEPRGTIELPDLGTVGGLTGRRGDRVSYFTFESFTRPPEVHGFDFDEGVGSVLLRPALEYDPDQFRVRQVGFESEDGTPLKMFVVHREELALDAENPTLLFGYGGFDIALTPTFSVENLVFCERGGVFAQATLRGGGEYGAAWHEAGMREQKQNVFADFTAAAEFLIRNDFTSAERLAIRGRSNGGLLVGAAMTQRPTLFGAAIPEAGVLDMLRYHRFTVGWAWESEYGSSDDPVMFRTLLDYSPLHNVVAGTEYPATLITTADQDDRVFPGHSYKFAAALQAAQAGDLPILLRVDRSAAHGPGRHSSFELLEATDRLAFLAAVIGG